jgi:glucose/mannose-6-phosphate isomerase
VKVGHELDSLGMFEAAAGLGDQVRAAAAAAASIDGLPSAQGITSVVVAGMGGSGIGGDLTAAVCGPVLDVPVVVPKGYEIPHFVGPDTLIFCVSSSGNTEETIEVAKDAVGRGARLVVITAGGELGRLANDWGVPVIPIDPTIPMPRAGIGAVSVPPLVVLERLGLLDGVIAEIDRAADHLDARAEKLCLEGSEAALLARRIGRTMPIIYGGGLVGEVAALRWKGQFNENAKVAAFANRIPELTHNEICGWGQHGDVTRQVFSLILLRHAAEHPQTRRRFELVAEICDEVVADVHTVEAQGAGTLAQMLDLVMLGDFVTLEAAVQAGIDPGPVPILDYIKQSLRD